MIVECCERMTVRVAREWEVPLEVHLPKNIWRVFLEALIRLSRRAGGGNDAAMPGKDGMHGRCSRRLVTFAFQTAQDLARTPRRMSVANAQHQCFQCAITSRRRALWPPRSIRQCRVALRPSLEPFVTNVRADPEPTT